MTIQGVRWADLIRAAILVMGLMALAPAPASAQQSADGTRFEGTLIAVWGDPRPGAGGGETRFSIVLPDGTKYGLEASSAQQNVALRYFGKPVVVQGRLTRNTSGKARIAVAQIHPGAQGKFETRAAEVRRVLYILLRFKGDTQEPHPPTFFRELTNPLTVPAGSNVVATLNGFFTKTSYGHLKWRADVLGRGGLNPTHWLTLPKTKAEYAPCGWSDACADLDGIETDALAMATGAGVDMSVYDNINYVLNNDLDCCAWGGGTFFNGKFYGATWEPPWGQEAGIYVHELGHSIGLPHSGWVYHAYDSPWDQMSSGSSANSQPCGNYVSANSGGTQPLSCSEPGGGYITAHKDHLGWIPAANKIVINRATTRNIALEANSWPLSTGIKMIKICLPGLACTGDSARYLTVEARLTGKKYDNGLPGDGVVIHDFQAARGPIGVGNACFFNSQSGWAVLVDATKGDYQGEPACSSGGLSWPDYGLGNAQFQPGMTYNNKVRGITVMVNRKLSSGYSVTVTRAP